MTKFCQNQLAVSEIFYKKNDSQPNDGYTWRQVAEKNNEKEAWIIVRDKVYNVTGWLNKHPGGKKMLLLHADQHIVGHHIYTNVAGIDPDLPVNFESDVRRIVRRQMLRPIYAWQHIYLPPLYGFLTLKFRLQDFTHTFLTRSNGAVRVNPISSRDWLSLISSKLFWICHRIWLPLYVLQAPQFWLTFLLSEFVTGLYLAFNFQVSHISPSCKYQCDDSRDCIKISDEWAVSQIESSVDYAHGSWLIAFLSGGLNYQATHHLFPTISQYHLPQIAPIVQQVCHEYGINYVVLPSFFDAFKAHLLYLKLMGTSGKRVDVHMG